MSAEAEDNNEAIAAWEEPKVGDGLDSEGALIVDVAGYEGPLDLLLALARTQKVDISKISVLAPRRSVPRLHLGSAKAKA